MEWVHTLTVRFMTLSKLSLHLIVLGSSTGLHIDLRKRDSFDALTFLICCTRTSLSFSHGTVPQARGLALTGGFFYLTVFTKLLAGLR